MPNAMPSHARGNISDVEGVLYALGFRPSAPDMRPVRVPMTLKLACSLPARSNFLKSSIFLARDLDGQYLLGSHGRRMPALASNSQCCCIVTILAPHLVHSSSSVIFQLLTAMTLALRCFRPERTSHVIHALANVATDLRGLVAIHRGVATTSRASPAAA